MKEDFISKLRRWKDNPSQFFSDTSFWIKTHPRLLYAIGLVIVGAVILSFVD